MFALWIVLVPASPERDAQLAAQLFELPAWATVGWVVFRFVGSAITVALAEELAFRGYLLARLGGRAPEVSGALPFGWFPFLASSVLFGLLHGQWLAGTLAGMAYALARYHRSRTADAVVAHMTTNVLLSGFVLATGRWGYW